MDDEQEKQNKIAPRILVVEDSDDDYELLVRELGRAGFAAEIERVQSRETMSAALERQPWDIILSDNELPGFSGSEALALANEKRLDVPFILLSGTVGERVAVEAMRAGARDYIMKEARARLIPAIRRELHESEERRALAATLADRENQLRQAQKMEAMGQLAGGIAHDFNNILAAIFLNVEAALEAKTSGGDWKENLLEIKQTSERAASLVRQLLAFSRKQVLQPRVLSLNTLVTDMLGMLRRLIGEHIELETRLSPELGRVLCDPAQLEQVVLNLVVNARDAMPGGGKLSISTENAGDHVRLAVEDTGCGMDAATKARVFEPFFTTKGAGGTGMGLATVFGIVEKSGGFLKVESEPGDGSRFSACFPQVDDWSYPEEPAAAPMWEAEGSETILLVEDDDAVRRGVAAGLGNKGYRVLAAANAAEALRIFESHDGPIPLIVTDVVMPGMSGSELANLEVMLPETKILFVSGFPEGFAELGEARKTRFLAKPFTADELARRIREILGEG